ncbi:hypothetical protein DVH24_018497 [Malus domestica]|uniref:Uncharacterized protein n=1 Tax=Malus domestica TaxID=3750 RepID=A0A498KL09_MALDO|nr:hypothetical protein DVH24_018497 [Malus domestica]
MDESVWELGKQRSRACCLQLAELSQKKNRPPCVSLAWPKYKQCPDSPFTISKGECFPLPREQFTREKTPQPRMLSDPPSVNLAALDEGGSIGIFSHLFFPHHSNGRLQGCLLPKLYAQNVYRKDKLLFLTSVINLNLAFKVAKLLAKVAKFCLIDNEARIEFILRGQALHKNSLKKPYHSGQSPAKADLSVFPQIT